MDYLENILTGTGCKEMVESTKISREELLRVRNEFHVLKDRRL